jgi:hypothetical protein
MAHLIMRREENDSSQPAVQHMDDITIRSGGVRWNSENFQWPWATAVTIERSRFPKNSEFSRQGHRFDRLLKLHSVARLPQYDQRFVRTATIARYRLGGGLCRAGFSLFRYACTRSVREAEPSGLALRPPGVEFHAVP